MKIILYMIAGILILIWGIFFWGFNASSLIHLLLAAAILILLNLIFNNQLFNNIH
ncbi:MAG: hypothetical protein JXJ22_04870 [Bacteroidales bacterium]|nr:hypothetical protein [Bacteroidales bacterium]